MNKNINTPQFNNPEFIPKGKLLEREIEDAFFRYSAEIGERGNEYIFRKSTEEQDLYEGTDMFVYGVPVDITCDLYGKDHTEIVGPAVLLGDVSYNVQFGIRTANYDHEFDRPVAVVGIESGYSYEHFTRREIVEIASHFQANIEDVMIALFDVYIEYCDENDIPFHFI